MPGRSQARRGKPNGPGARGRARGARAIPTTVDGIKFRSKLEATWHLFFQRAGWFTEYEPDEHPFRGYLPDFELFDLAGNHVCYLEVKPIRAFRVEAKRSGQRKANADAAAIEDLVVRKLSKSGAPAGTRIMLIGAGPAQGNAADFGKMLTLGRRGKISHSTWIKPVRIADPGVFDHVWPRPSIEIMEWLIEEARIDWFEEDEKTGKVRLEMTSQELQDDSQLAIRGSIGDPVTRKLRAIWNTCRSKLRWNPDARY